MTVESIKKILATPSIGNFRCVELFEVIGTRSKNPAFNIFTLAIAHETDLRLINEEEITPKLVQLETDKSLKFGVLKSIIPIEDFFNRISDLNTKITNKDSKNNLVYGRLKGIPAVHAPALGQDKNEFLGLLKNNFFGGSHLFEWFDESKEHVASLIENLKSLDELSKKLQEYLPIKIGSHSDRLGNIILQIPCSAVAFVIERRYPNSHQLLSNLAVSPHISEEVKLSGIFWREQHGSMIDFQKIPLAKGRNIIPFQQINGRGHYAIWDENNQIICAGGEIPPIIELINFSTYMQEHDQRIFRLPDGTEQKINISTQASQSQIGKNIKDHRDWVRNRLLKTERQELHDSLKLRQFKQDIPQEAKQKMHREALDFIRKLIKTYSQNGIYLWDPYLSAQDLLKTVFFCPYANVPIKALTSKKALKKNKELPCRADLKNEINQAILQAGWLNLTFVKASTENFHDRFIIFPQAKDEPVRAWSLGTSVNGLGKSHHIIQEVEDGQIIADIFEEMWEQSISDEGNILWKSKKN
jgi:hypothetical protein